MNIATKLMASLVASLVITACSGGSSGSSAQSNTEFTPKTNMSAPKAEQPKKEEAPQADSPKVEKPKEMIPQVDSLKGEKPKEMVPQVDSPKVEKPKEMVPQVDSPKVEKPKEMVPQVDSPKVEEPKNMAPQIGSPKVEEPKNMVPQMGIPKPNDPQVMAPKMDNPQKDDPKREDLNNNKSNTEILKELRVEDIKNGIISRPDVVLNLVLDEKENVKITLSGSDITRNDLKITNTIPNQDIRTLKDSTGRLLGYYGYMQLNQVREGERYGINNAELVGHYLLSVGESSKMLPNKSMEYKGTMLYNYKSIDNQNLVADVQAKYDDLNKKLSMEIFGNGEDYWKLGTIGRNKLASNKVNGVSVAADGSIANANLYSKTNDPLKLTPDANFSGGLFGKNGEVLAGKAESIKGEWQGAIGATATEEKK